MYSWNERVYIKQYNKSILICNRENGEIAYMTEEGFNFIDSILKSEECVKKYSGETARYLENIFSNLLNRGFVISEDIERNHKEIILYWDITSACNLKCIHCCSYGHEELEKKVIDYKQFIKKICSINPSTIVISGGEPLLLSDFKNIVEEVRKVYNNNLSLMSNGTLIDEEMAQFIAENFTDVSISLDGYDEETCSFIRGKDTFDKAIRGIKLLKERGLSQISSSMLLTQKTYDKRNKFIELCESLDIKPMFRSLTLDGRAKENIVKLKLEKDPKDFRNITDIEQYKEDIIKERYHLNRTCGATYTQFQISENGNIYPCQLMQDAEFYLGNVMQIDNLKEFIVKRQFINTAGYKNFIKYMPENLEGCEECPVNIFCHTCPAEDYLRKNNNHRLEDCKLRKEIYICQYGK